MGKLTILAAVAGILAGCTLNDAGLQHLSAGRHAQAVQAFTQCANQGDPACMFNLGGMYERGLVRGGSDIDRACDYYHLAARMGLGAAQQALLRLGREIPQNDLESAYRQRLAAEAAMMQKLSADLLRAAQPWNYAPPVALLPPDPLVPLAPVAPPQQIVVTPATVQAQVLAVPAECTSDFGCGYGRICVRPAGVMGKGMCVVPVNTLGVRTFESISPETEPREVPSCESFSDCPLGFSCIKGVGQLRGFCMKRQ